MRAKKSTKRKRYPNSQPTATGAWRARLKVHGQTFMGRVGERS